MAITLEELREHPERIEELHVPDPKCSVCGDPVTDHPDLRRYWKGELVCEDCFPEKVFELVGSRPITLDLW